jgi:hypothetical protein
MGCIFGKRRKDDNGSESWIPSNPPTTLLERETLYFRTLSLLFLKGEN